MWDFGFGPLTATWAQSSQIEACAERNQVRAIGWNNSDDCRMPCLYHRNFAREELRISIVILCRRGGMRSTKKAIKHFTRRRSIFNYLKNVNDVILSKMVHLERIH